MKHYIIDGNNLLHAIAEVRNSADQRSALIEYLRSAKFFGGSNAATVVFDGDLDPNSSLKAGAKIRTIFGKNKKADDVICELVGKEAVRFRERIVVVSDDREVINAAKEHRVRAMKNAEFIGVLGKTGPSDNDALSADKKDKITEELSRIWLGK